MAKNFLAMGQFILKRIRLPAPRLGGHRRFPVLFSAYELQGNHNTNHSHTGDIRHKPRVNQKQTAHDRKDTLPNRHLAIDEARQTGRYAEETDNRSQHDQNDLQRCSLNEEQRRTHDKDVRYDKCRNRQTSGRKSSLHRVRTRNRTAGVSCQSNRRRDVGDNAEVENNGGVLDVNVRASVGAYLEIVVDGQSYGVTAVNQ